MVSEVASIVEAVAPIAVKSLLQETVQDVIISTAQHLFNLISKHVPNGVEKSTALINLNHVVSLVAQAITTIDSVAAEIEPKA
ncbi:MAG TPA: hypothetical protein VHZ76_00925 [Gammaproteobacteria bacterium]|jgi:hypothetical protein|nr:hypothetical protein [Gammaproteobacteria bacterium]